MKTLLEWLEENSSTLKDGVYEINKEGMIVTGNRIICDYCELTTDKYQVKNGNITLVNKYNRQCKGVTIDVYDVLKAFEVTDPALQHLVKKSLCAGLRGYKTMEQDLQEVLESAKRAIELNK